MYTLSVLVSGAGSTLDNLAFHCRDEMEGMIRGFCDVTQVVADRECKALDVADRWGIPARICERIDYDSDEEWSEHLLDFDGHLHVMGGFLSKIVVPAKWKNRVLNIHPSLLPAYGGKGMHGIKVHEAVVAAGETVTGCTVHVVDDEYDHGPILAQIKQAVLSRDTPEDVQQVVGKMEKLLYPRAILNYCRGKQ